MIIQVSHCFFFFFFNDTAPTDIYPLPLHDALPISAATCPSALVECIHARSEKACAVSCRSIAAPASAAASRPDRKSTRLNSSHSQISYAVFCLKKKKQEDTRRGTNGNRDC